MNLSLVNNSFALPALSDMCHVSDGSYYRDNRVRGHFQLVHCHCTFLCIIIMISHRLLSNILVARFRGQGLGTGLQIDESMVLS